jgi:hypothetical protein
MPICKLLTIAIGSRANVTANVTRSPSLLHSLERQIIQKGPIVATSSIVQDPWMLSVTELLRLSSLHWLLTSLHATFLLSSGDILICITISARITASTLIDQDHAAELLIMLADGCRDSPRTPTSCLWILVPILVTLVSTTHSISSELSQVSPVGEISDAQHRRHHAIQYRLRLR